MPGAGAIAVVSVRVTAALDAWRRGDLVDCHWQLERVRAACSKALTGRPRDPRTGSREPAPAPRCPYCDRVMSHREAAEQGACNDCNGGAYWPEPDAAGGPR